MKRAQPAWIHPLPTAEWPAADRSAWIRATDQADFLEHDGGLAAHWKPRSRRTIEIGYGRWLSYLKHCEKVRFAGKLEERVTPARLRRYVAKLQSRVSPRSVTSLVVALKEMLRVAAPHYDLSWLMAVCNRLNRTSPPLHLNRRNVRPTKLIVSRALKELGRLTKHQPLNQEQKLRYRDVFMLAMMATRPLRLANFGSLVIGQSLISTTEAWHIRVSGSETKNGRAIHFTVPIFLIDPLNFYLREVRPSLLRDPANMALWPGRKDGHLGGTGMYMRIVAITRDLIGARINPHLLRDCAATTLAVDSPASGQRAGPLLGHATYKSAERYYIQADNLEASRQINAVLEPMIEAERKGTKPRRSTRRQASERQGECGG